MVDLILTFRRKKIGPIMRRGPKGATETAFLRSIISRRRAQFCLPLLHSRNCEFQCYGRLSASSVVFVLLVWEERCGFGWTPSSSSPFTSRRVRPPSMRFFSYRTQPASTVILRPTIPSITSSPFGWSSTMTMCKYQVSFANVAGFCVLDAPRCLISDRLSHWVPTFVISHVYFGCMLARPAKTSVSFHKTHYW